jgi:2-aminoethylphosphonate-pyruvate transaminase
MLVRMLDCPSILFSHGQAFVMDKHIGKGLSETGDPLLLTPGPLTTSRTVKAAMQHDWGSRDASFIEMNAAVRNDLLTIAGVSGSDYVAVPLQGSGTFAVEAMLTNFVPHDGEVLLIINGVYGQRAKKICEIGRRRFVVYETAEDIPPSASEVADILRQNPSLTHVFLVHCETTSGILNPAPAIAELARTYGKGFLIDAMSSFAAVPIDAGAWGVAALAASANKCLQGVPGFGFVICKKRALIESHGNATTLVLDLYDQYQGFQKNGQWRFTPPTHVVAGFHQALVEFHAEGGVVGRSRRYAENCRILVGGMQALGFRPLLPASLQAPIIVTFRIPADARFQFQRFYDALKDRGYIIYPGKLTVAESFRIGCIGALNADHMRSLIACVRDILAEMGVRHGAPAAVA